jgi:LPXTG-motif cell wall-anchored protein
MRRTNQGGSLAVFIIIGVVLTLVLVGGLYGLNRYNDAQNTEDIAVTEEPNPTEESTDTGDEAAAPQEQESAPQSRTDELPQTGPADTVFAIVAAALLTFAGVHYARSRTAS